MTPIYRPWRIPGSRFQPRAELGLALCPRNHHDARPLQRPHSDNRESEPISTHGREPVTAAMWTVALRRLAYCAALCPC